MACYNTTLTRTAVCSFCMVITMCVLVCVYTWTWCMHWFRMDIKMNWCKTLLFACMFSALIVPGEFQRSVYVLYILLWLRMWFPSILHSWIVDTCQSCCIQWMWLFVGQYGVTVWEIRGLLWNYRCYVILWLISTFVSYTIYWKNQFHCRLPSYYVLCQLFFCTFCAVWLEIKYA